MVTKRTFGLALLAVTLFTAGCQAAPPVAAVAPEAPPIEAPQGTGLRVLSLAATRRLMQAAPSIARLWGMQFRTAYWATENLGRPSAGSSKSRKKSRDWAAANGVTLIRDGNFFIAYRDIGWAADYSFEGEGGRDAMVLLDKAKFEYKVPAGRALIINRIEAAQNMTINQFPMAVAGLERANNVEAVNYVFGPGESIIFTFPYRNKKDAFGRDGCNCASSVSGMTIDPAVLGGALPDVTTEAK